MAAAVLVWDLERRCERESVGWDDMFKKLAGVCVVDRATGELFRKGDLVEILDGPHAGRKGVITMIEPVKLVQGRRCLIRLESDGETELTALTYTKHLKLLAARGNRQ
jgi:hypothetical protein